MIMMVMTEPSQENKSASFMKLSPLSQSPYLSPLFISTPSEELELKKKKKRKHLYDLTLSATTHGLPNIVFTEHNRYLRLMWLTLFILSVSACVYSINENIREYLDFKVA